MARTRCQCGATVDVAEIQGTAEHVPLELAPDFASDAPRFKVVAQNPLIVVKVARGAVGHYLVDHRSDCSAYDAGR